MKKLTTPLDLLERLAAAQRRKADLDARFETYDGNNPDKYVIARQRAYEDVECWTRRCRAAGLIQVTEHEALEQRMNKAFPSWKSRGIVHFEGKFYRRRYVAASHSRSGNPTSWNGHWDEVSDTDPDVVRLKEPSEFETYRHALRELWPFRRPAGGVEYKVSVGEPAMVVARSSSTVAYTKGHPDVRLMLKVTIATSLEDWTKLVAAAQQGADTSQVRTDQSLRIAGIGAATGWEIHKAGRRMESLELVHVGV